MHVIRPAAWLALVALTLLPTSLLAQGMMPGGGMGGMPRGGTPSQFGKPKGGSDKSAPLFKLPSWAGGPDEQRAEELYVEGKALFDKAMASTDPAKRRELATQAADALWWAKRRSTDYPIEEDVLFYYAESLFFSDAYPQAVDLYGQLVKKFPNSKYLQKTVAHLFLIAQYWEKLDAQNGLPALVPNMFDSTRPRYDTSGKALSIYRTIQQADPTGPLTDDALMAMAVANYMKEDYENAAFFFERLRKEHPQSEHQPKAHLLAIQAELSCYQGAQYDGESLDDVEKLVKASLYQFPDELAGKQQEILRTQETVREQRAERDFQMAEYYKSTRHYRAARFYYDTVIKEYPDTKYAVQARKRMQTIQNRPANPAPPLPWLVKLFEHDNKLR